MKRIVALLIIILFIPFSAQGYFAEEEPRKKLVALGDSITRGYGLNAGEKCYVDILAEEFDFDSKNFAVNGQTSTVLLEALQKLSSEEKQALERADYIVMSIGGNDMLYMLETRLSGVLPSDSMSNPAESISNLMSLAQKLTPENISSDVAYYKKTVKEIIEIIRGINENAEITLQTVYNPFKPIFVVAPVILPTQSEQIKVAHNNIDNCIAGFNTALIELSKTYDFRIADVCNDFKNSDKKYLNMSLSNPDIHPNAEGHKRIAEIVEESFEELKPVTASVSSNSNLTSENKIDKSQNESAIESIKDRENGINSGNSEVFSTESESNVENSSVLKDSNEENDDYSHRLFIFIGVMAVLSIGFTFIGLKRKNKKNDS